MNSNNSSVKRTLYTKRQTTAREQGSDTHDRVLGGRPRTTGRTAGT